MRRPTAETGAQCIAALDSIQDKFAQMADMLDNVTGVAKVLGVALDNLKEDMKL
jgi:hypothetical protein